jgi:hypothetical protein
MPQTATQKLPYCCAIDLPLVITRAGAIWPKATVAGRWGRYNEKANSPENFLNKQVEEENAFH